MPDADTTIESAERAFAAKPDDVEAATGLAQQLVRRGMSDAARQTLLTCETTITGRNPLQIRGVADELRVLRGARFALGLFTHTATEADEWLSWPSRSVSAPTWQARAHAGSEWTFAVSTASHRLLVVQQVARQRAKSMVCGFDLRTGGELWRYAISGELLDCRIVDADDTVLVWAAEPSEGGNAHNVTWLNGATGTVQSQQALPGAPYRRPLLRLGAALIAASHGAVDEGAVAPVEVAQGLFRVGVTPGLVQPISASDLALAQQLLLRLHTLPSSPPTNFVLDLLDIAGPIGRVWWHASDGGAWILVETADLTCGLFWVAPDGTVSDLNYERRGSRDILWLPRLFRCGDAHVATLNAHEVRLSAQVSRSPTPTGRVLRVASREVWAFDRTGLERLPYGHADSGQALVASGVWYQLRPSPLRVACYTTSASGPRPHWHVKLEAPPSRPWSVGPWRRPMPPVAGAVLPLGPHLLVAEGQMLSCRQLVE